MTEATERADGRTHYEAVLDVRYGVRFNAMCETFYNRLDGMLTFVTAVGGTGAAASYLNSNAGLAAASGIVLAAAAVLGLVISPARKAEQHGHAKRSFGLLASRANHLTLSQIDAELRALQSSFPAGLSSLANPAYNANLRTAGRMEYAVPLTITERIACACV